MINEFERMYGAFLSKKRSEASIEELLAWAAANVPAIFDHHEIEDLKDLRMLEEYAKSYSLYENSPDSLEVSLLREANKRGII